MANLTSQSCEWWFTAVCLLVNMMWTLALGQNTFSSIKLKSLKYEVLQCYVYIGWYYHNLNSHLILTLHIYTNLYTFIVSFETHYAINSICKIMICELMIDNWQENIMYNDNSNLLSKQITSGSYANVLLHLISLPFQLPSLWQVLVSLPVSS